MFLCGYNLGYCKLKSYSHVDFVCKLISKYLLFFGLLYIINLQVGLKFDK